MKLILVLIGMTLSLNAYAGRSKLTFKADSPYLASEQQAIETAIRTNCPELLEGRRALVQEEETQVEARRVDQNMFDHFYVSSFSFQTTEGPGIFGTLTLRSDRPYAGELGGFELSVEPTEVCSW